MKLFSKIMTGVVSAAFCSVLAISVNARADDISHDGFADAPAELPAYQVILPDDFVDAPLEIPEDVFSVPSEEFAEAPDEVPEDMFVISEAPDEVPDEIVWVSENETVTDPTDPTEAVPDETVLESDDEFSDAPEEIPYETVLPPEDVYIEVTTEAQYEMLSLTEGQIEFTPPDYIFSEEKIAVPSDYFIDAPEEMPIYSDFEIGGHCRK